LQGTPHAPDDKNVKSLGGKSAGKLWGPLQKAGFAIPKKARTARLVVWDEPADTSVVFCEDAVEEAKEAGIG